VREVSSALQTLLAEVEARVDFAEDVGGVEVPAHVALGLEAAEARLAELLEHAGYARAVREGARIPIVGRPNVGKSSLFNALLGEERALVTEMPGTTRDRVSESVEWGGVRLVLCDTAGIRDDAERIEAMGIAHAEALLDESPAALWVVDAAAALEPADRRIAARLHGKHAVVALNKIDAGERVAAAEVTALLEPPAAAAATRAAASCVVRVSARERRGIDAVRTALLAALGGDGPPAAFAAAASNPRHVEALERARGAIRRALALAADGSPGELVAVELRDGAEAIGEVTGESIGADLLDRIFSRFCIGK
jgi:tRNA modification GTPase